MLPFRVIYCEDMISAKHGKNEHALDFFSHFS